MARTDAVLALLADALRGLVEFVDTRPADATDDDDVRALEDVAYVLSQVAPEDRGRLVDALGETLSRSVGLIE